MVFLDITMQLPSMLAQQMRHSLFHCFKECDLKRHSDTHKRCKVRIFNELNMTLLMQATVTSIYKHIRCFSVYARVLLHACVCFPSSVVQQRFLFSRHILCMFKGLKLSLLQKSAQDLLPQKASAMYLTTVYSYNFKPTMNRTELILFYFFSFVHAQFLNDNKTTVDLDAENINKERKFKRDRKRVKSTHKKENRLIVGCLS